MQSPCRFVSTFLRYDFGRRCLALDQGLSAAVVAVSPRRSVRDAFAAMRALPSQALVDAIGAPDAPLNDRLAAGTILALLGDPRIDPLNPAMVEIPAGRATIGLEPD